MKMKKFPEEGSLINCTLKKICFHCPDAKIEVVPEKWYEWDKAYNVTAIFCTHCDVCKHYEAAEEEPIISEMLKSDDELPEDL